MSRLLAPCLWDHVQVATPRGPITTVLCGFYRPNPSASGPMPSLLPCGPLDPAMCLVLLTASDGWLARPSAVTWLAPGPFRRPIPPKGVDGQPVRALTPGDPERPLLAQGAHDRLATAGWAAATSRRILAWRRAHHTHPTSPPLRP